MTTDDSPAMRRLMNVYDAYEEARRDLLDAAVDANRDGEGANEIARRLSGIPGLGRNRLLAVLAAGRRAAAVRELVETDADYRNLYVNRVDDEVTLSSSAPSPLGPERARKLWTALAGKGLTIAPAIDGGSHVPAGPEAALAALTYRDSGDVTELAVVALRTR
jgi:hypothetical protein